VADPEERQVRPVCGLAASLEARRRAYHAARRIALRMSLWRRWAVGTLIFAALASWFVVPSSADSFSLSPGTPMVRLDHGVGGGAVGGWTYPVFIPGIGNEDLGTLVLNDQSRGGQVVEAYCIDIRTHRAVGAAYTTGPRALDEIAYILNHTFPAVPTAVASRHADGSPDLDSEAAAVQLALWSVSDGVNIAGVTAQRSVPTIEWIKQRAAGIRADADRNWVAWAGQQRVSPAVALSSTSATAPGNTDVAATVTGGPNGVVADGTLVTFTVGSPAGTVNGQRSATAPTNHGVAHVVARMEAPGTLSVSASVTVAGLAAEQLQPSGPGQRLVLATPLPVPGAGTLTVRFIGAPKLTFSKLVATGKDQPSSASTARPGDLVTYTLTFANTGNATAPAVVITDNLSQGALAQLDIQKVVLVGGVGHALSGRVAIWNLGDVAPGATGSVSFQAVIPSVLNPNGGAQSADFCNVGQLTFVGAAPIASNQACEHVTAPPATPPTATPVPTTKAIIPAAATPVIAPAAPVHGAVLASFTVTRVPVPATGATSAGLIRPLVAGVLVMLAGLLVVTSPRRSRGRRSRFHV